MILHDLGVQLSIDPLRAASRPPSRILDPDQFVSVPSLNPVYEEAVRRWAALGLDETDVDRLRSVELRVSSLPDSYLGLEGAGDDGGSIVWVDEDAAGYGWFIDSSPSDDREFSVSEVTNEAGAIAASPAFGRMDLLSVVMHELGHVLGLAHSDSGINPFDVMGETLPPDVRRLPAGSKYIANSEMLHEGQQEAEFSPLLTQDTGFSSPAVTYLTDAGHAPKQDTSSAHARLQNVLQSGSDAIYILDRYHTGYAAPAHRLGLVGADVGPGPGEILLAGDGDDVLIGESGGDVLVGGIGSHKLIREGGKDLLFGVSTAFDNQAESLRAIRSEWVGIDLDYAGRVDHLRGVGSGLDGSVVLNNQTVIDDNAVDMLIGGSKTDWFVADSNSPTGDVLVDKITLEFVDALGIVP